jgi:hypothetical protein
VFAFPVASAFATTATVTATATVTTGATATGAIVLLVFHHREEAPISLGGGAMGVSDTSHEGPGGAVFDCEDQV